MKLNNERKNDLRIKIEQLLLNVPEGNRIHLESELLEDLIFFKSVDKAGKQFKIPVWTGEFLRKIDLSELSFENAWFCVGDDYSCCEIKENLDNETLSKFKKTGDMWYAPPIIEGVKREYDIDFSETNIKVDFSKLYDKNIEYTNFEGVDLSNSNFESISKIGFSNLAKTNIKIDFVLNSEDKFFREVNLSNNNFSDVSLNCDYILYYEGTEKEDNVKFSSCNFANTGININYVPEESEDIEFQKYISSELGNEIKTGKLNGCFINGKRIHTPEERINIANKKMAEYEEYCDNLFNSVESSIEEQIGKMRK